MDIVRYNYPCLNEAEEADGVQLASSKDIAAMKLNAMAGLGAKKTLLIWISC